MPHPYSSVVIGAGAFGTAIAAVLGLSHPTKLWCRDPEIADEINRFKTNRHYLPEITLPHSIQATANLNQALTGANLIFQAVPVKFLRSVLEQAKPLINNSHAIISLSKGMETGSHLLPTQIIEQIVGSQITTAVMAGPTFAHELANRQLSAITIASKDQKLIEAVQALINQDFFTIESSTDVIGVQLCGVMKNIITLAVGIAQSVGCGENGIAFLVTRGLLEIEVLIKKLNPTNDTATYKLAGVGDLILTALGTRSKNLMAGKLFGQGKTIHEVEQHMQTLPEGLNSVISIQEICKKEQLHLPICNGVYRVIFEQLPPQEFIYQVCTTNIQN